MVGKNMDEIRWWKNRRYGTKSTRRYQIGGDSTRRSLYACISFTMPKLDVYKKRFI
jgi:hypothetical protein